MEPLRPFGTQLEIPDAIESMLWVFENQKDPILLLSTLTPEGFIGPGEAIDLSRGWPSTEVLFELPRRLGASAVLTGTRATRSVFDPDQRDIDLFWYLVESGEKAGIFVDEHVLVEGNKFRLMRESARDGLI